MGGGPGHSVWRDGVNHNFAFKIKNRFGNCLLICVTLGLCSLVLRHIPPDNGPVSMAREEACPICIDHNRADIAVCVVQGLGLVGLTVGCAHLSICTAQDYWPFRWPGNTSNRGCLDKLVANNLFLPEVFPNLVHKHNIVSLCNCQLR